MFPTRDVFTQFYAPSGTANIKRQKGKGFQFSRNCVKDDVNESIAPEWPGIDAEYNLLLETQLAQISDIPHKPEGADFEVYTGKIPKYWQVCYYSKRSGDFHAKKTLKVGNLKLLEL